MKIKPRLDYAFRYGDPKIQSGTLSSFLDTDFPLGGSILKQANPTDGHSLFQVCNLYLSNSSRKRGPYSWSFSTLVIRSCA